MNLPVDWCLTMLLEIGIGLRKMSAANEASIGTQWARMNGGKDQMLSTVDILPLALSITTPQHKNNIRSLIIKRLYCCICQFFPSFSLVATSPVCFHSKGSIEQQDTLLCPMCEVARGGDWLTQITLKFLVDIHQ